MLRAIVIIALLASNLAFWGTLVLLGGIIKLTTGGRVRRAVVLGLAWMGERWVAGNNLVFDLLLHTEWRSNPVDGLRHDGHYLVISNHLSWIDIFAVLRRFHRSAPMMRFFLKQQLIWFPVVGQAAWALEFPFMRRYEPEYLERHPEKRGRDLETTRRACRRYRDVPVTILNYIEGTRFSPQKKAAQQSPYVNLLRPRVGGVAFVLASLGEHLDAVYDATLVYPRHDVTMWDFVTDRVPWITIEVRRIEVPEVFRNDAITRPGPLREQFRGWVEDVWREKDRRITEIRAAQ